MTAKDKPPASYEDAGVSIERGNQLVERIKSAAQSTFTRGVMGNLGGFGALFDPKPLGFKDPVLVSGTDGVGTKIKMAIKTGIHDTIGIDLVAMCVNDLVVQGARPLFFLDYFATSRLDVDIASRVITGIAEGCQLAGCALIGGETAEMPGMYADGDYDLAGFCVGAVERDELIDGSQVASGDVLIALASSGPHSNGFSLIHRLVEEEHINSDFQVGNRSLREQLLMPTRIYVRPLLQLMQTVSVHAASHITGGGMTENIPRVLPDGLDALIDPRTWSLPPVFAWLQKQGNIALDEMYRTFNCGVGMIISVSESESSKALTCLTQLGETAWIVGRVQENGQGGRQVVFNPL